MNERVTATAQRLYERYRYSGAAFWNELTDEERRGWERVARTFITLLTVMRGNKGEMERHAKRLERELDGAA